MSPFDSERAVTRRQLSLCHAEFHPVVGGGPLEQELGQAAGQIEEDEITREFPEPLTIAASSADSAIRAGGCRSSAARTVRAGNTSTSTSSCATASTERGDSSSRSRYPGASPGPQHQVAAVIRPDPGLRVTRAQHERRVAGITEAEERLLGLVAPGPRDTSELTQGRLRQRREEGAGREERQARLFRKSRIGPVETQNRAPTSSVTKQSQTLNGRSTRLPRNGATTSLRGE